MGSCDGTWFHEFYYLEDICVKKNLAMTRKSYHLWIPEIIFNQYEYSCSSTWRRKIYGAIPRSVTWLRFSNSLIKVAGNGFPSNRAPFTATHRFFVENSHYIRQIKI